MSERRPNNQKPREKKMINNKENTSQLMDYQRLSEINCKIFIINIFNKKIKQWRNLLEKWNV